MIKFTSISPATKKYLQWQWCIIEDKSKQLNPDRCSLIYSEYVKEIQKIETKKNDKNVFK